MSRRCFLILFLLIGSCGPRHTQEIPDGSRLIVVLCIDQMLPDYFDLSRFHYTGGLKKLYSQGFFYSNADLNYANTLTAPGHATLSTGAYPRVSGITNNWIQMPGKLGAAAIEDESSNTVEGSGHFSPKNLLVTSVGYWLTGESKESKVLSIAGKDRSAIFMGGRKPTQVYWYDSSTGHMVTSTYYRNNLPDWVKAFNANYFEKVPSAWFPSTGSAFSHPLEPDIKRRHEETPFHDSRILDFALQAVREEKLGRRGVPDLLWIGLSATDHIGHTYGTESEEMRDNLMRLDLSLGMFLTEMEKLFPEQEVLFVLTADHGALRFADRKIDFDLLIKPSILKLDQAIQEEWGLKSPVIQLSGTQGGFLDYTSAQSHNVDPHKLELELREELIKIDGISDVYFRNELSMTSTPLRPFLEQFRNSYYPPRELDFVFRFCEKCLAYTGSPPPTHHGSPYKYDSHIPLLFWGKGIPLGRSDRPVHMVDVAPTIAGFLRIKYPSSVDGTPLKEVLPK